MPNGDLVSIREYSDIPLPKDPSGRPLCEAQPQIFYRADTGTYGCNDL